MFIDIKFAPYIENRKITTPVSRNEKIGSLHLENILRIRQLDVTQCDSA